MRKSVSKKSKTAPKTLKVADEKETPMHKTPVGDKKAFDQLLDDAIFGVPKVKTGK